MFNLIRRDVILQKRQLLIFLPFILVFIFLNVPPVLVILVACIFIPYNTYAYDEKAETNILLNSLPYTRKEIIASRYLGAVAYMFLSIGLASFSLYMFNKTFTIMDIVIGGGLFLLFGALTFPIFYIFKPGYITTFVLISFILLTWISQPVTSFILGHLPVITEFVDNLSMTFIYIATTIAILSLYGISWGVSTLIYLRKEF
ncbi:ABC-2 transporter permease [Bacillus sp. RO3]|nr:ABC-2 transporter permease [Bacillus sp. RO3]